jgi:hypothetical protein
MKGSNFASQVTVLVLVIVGFVCFLMKIRLLSWNVRGLNSKHEMVKNLLRDWRYDVVCL